MPLLSNVAFGVEILSGSPGDTITYNGRGPPGSAVMLAVTATGDISVSGNSYSGSLNGFNLQSARNSLEISVSPVETINITGKPSWRTGDGVSQAGAVTGTTGRFTFANVPPGSYDIAVSGRPASGATSVSMTVAVAQPVDVGSGGTYTTSIDTSGLPSNVYTVRQDGTEVARVYLGVAPPATPTPNPPTATPVPTAEPTIEPTVTAIPTAEPTIEPTPAPTEKPAGGIIPTAAAAVETPVSPTMTRSNGIDIGLLVVILGIVLILVTAAVMSIRRNRK